jgi:hypothetical protein
MTTRRRLLVFGLLATLIGLGVGGWLLWPKSTAITRESAAKIQKGMTLAEVEAILGGPARDDTTGLIENDFDDKSWNVRFGVFKPCNDYQTWESDFVFIWVGFDENCCVVHGGSENTQARPGRSARQAPPLAAPVVAIAFQLAELRFKRQMRYKAEVHPRRLADAARGDSSGNPGHAGRE